MSTAHFMGHARGETYGMEHSPARFELPICAKSPGPGLFLTGVDLTMCGVPGAAWSGLATASALLGPKVIVEMARADPAPGRAEREASLRRAGSFVSTSAKSVPTSPATH